MDTQNVTKRRDKLRKLKCSETEDIQTVNSVRLTNFLLNVCLPNLLLIIAKKVESTLLNENKDKELI